MNPTVQRVDPGDKRSLRSWCALDAELHRDEPNFIPQLQVDLRKRFTGRALLHQRIDSALFASADGKARAAAMINHAWQEHHGRKSGSIGYLAASSAGALQPVIAEAERWLAEQGCDEAIVGYDGSFMAGMAVRSDAFDEPAVFPYNVQPPSWTALVRDTGYEPTYPWWFYRIDFASDVYRRVSSRAIANTRCAVRPLDKRRWAREITTFTALFNAAFVDEWEYHPVSADIWREALDPFRLIVKPWQILFAEVDGEPAGVTLGAFDYNPLLRKAAGRSGPLQLLRFLLGARRLRDGGLLIIAVDPRFQGKGIGQTLASKLYKNFEKAGLKGAWYYAVNDANRASRGLASSLGAQGRLLAHSWTKALPSNH